MTENIINMLRNKCDATELIVALNALPNRRAPFEDICLHLNIIVPKRPTISAMKNAIIEYNNNKVNVFSIDNLEELNSYLPTSYQQNFTSRSPMRIYGDYIADLCLQGQIDAFFGIWNGINNISYAIQEIRRYVSLGVEYKSHISSRIISLMQGGIFILADFITLLNRTKTLFPNPILDYFEQEMVKDLKNIMETFGY